MIQVSSEMPSFLLLIPSLKQCFSKFEFSNKSRESYYLTVPILLPWAYDSAFVIGFQGKADASGLQTTV